MTRRKTNKDAEGGAFFRWGIVVAFFLLFTVGTGWWIFASGSESKTRKAILAKASVFVDRIDELSEAWASRKTSRPGSEKKGDELTPDDREPAIKPSPRKAETGPVDPSPEPGYDNGKLKQILAEKNPADDRPKPEVSAVPSLAEPKKAAPEKPKPAKPPKTIEEALAEEESAPRPVAAPPGGDNAEITNVDKRELQDIFRNLGE